VEPPAAAPASTPTPPASSAAAATVTSAPAAAAASAKTETATDADTAARAKATEKRLRGQGYKPVVRNGVTYFCRNEASLGSRFQSPVCGTPEDLDRAALNAKETTEKIQRDVTEHQSN